MMDGMDVGKAKRGGLLIAAALLFMGAGTNGYDAFSAVMSSPWSTRKFTTSAEDEQLAKEYVRHAIVISGIYAGGSALLALLAGGVKLALAPVIGFVIVTAYMYRLYDRACTHYRLGGGTLAAGAGEAAAEIPILRTLTRARTLRQDG